MNSLIILGLFFSLTPVAHAAKKDVVVSFVARKNNKDLNALIKLCRRNKLPQNFEQNWDSMAKRGSPSDIKLLQYVRDHCSDGALSEIAIDLQGSLLFKHPEILFPSLATKVHSRNDLEFKQLSLDINTQLTQYGKSKNITKDNLIKKLSEPKLSGAGKRLRELVIEQINASYDMPVN